MSRLLILSCSDTKRALPAGSKTLAAMELYDGPAYKTVRSYLDRVPLMGAADLRVLILSAEHGLIGGWDHIAPYDRKMTAERAAELAKSNKHRDTLKRALQEGPDVLVYGGPLYRNCVAELVTRAMRSLGPDAIAGRGLTYVHGSGIGEHLAQLKSWLDAGTLADKYRAAYIEAELTRLETASGPADVARIDTLSRELGRLVRALPPSV